MARLKGNITYDIRTLQLLILKNLEALDRVCKEHNLRYYIIAGTLLGAVRHGGFIPWDDDLDVGMPREDYDKLIEHVNEWLPKQYELVCGELDHNYTLAFAKLQDSNTTLVERVSLSYIGGAYIDIFPIDGVPNGKMAQKWHFSRYRFYGKMLYFHARDPYKHGKNYKALPTLIIRSLMSTKKIHRKLRKILTKYKFADSLLVADYDDHINGILQKKMLGDPTPILFEGKEFFGVQDTDAYLTMKYKDYMQIPKKENQKQHMFDYLDMSTPYREIENPDALFEEIRVAKQNNQ